MSTRSLSLLKSVRTVFKLPISNLPIADFKLRKSAFLVNPDVSVHVATSDFAA